MSCSEIDCTSSILIILSTPGAKILASLTLSINLLPPRKIINFLFSIEFLEFSDNLNIIYKISIYGKFSEYSD